MPDPLAQELKTDEDAVRIVRKLVPEGEEILWGAHQGGPTWRAWPVYMLIGLVFAAVTLPVSPWSHFGVWSVFVAVAMAWYAAGEWFYIFAATSRRVILLRILPPRSWVYLDYTDMDANWVRSNVGRGVIKFEGFWYVFRASGLWSGLASQRSGMRGYIDNVPNIEAVRALLLNRISLAKQAKA